MKPRLKGRGFLVRYADDAVLLFSREEDARRVMEVLPKRFGKYGLTLHPEKTRLIEFQRPDRRPPRGGSSDRPGTFDLLGFTHYWGLSRKGKWVVKRKTARDRLSRAVKRVAQWCRLHRHHPIEEQQQTLAQKLEGTSGTTGSPGTSKRSNTPRKVVCVWRKWLGRRSQWARMTWDRMRKLLERNPLPRARILRPYSTA